MKDKGQNTLILTTGTGIKPCRGSGGIQLTYLGKNYLGTTQYWNGQNPDFATIITSVNIPTLSLYDVAIPAPGWWVDVVQNIKGFGLVWRRSKVLLYNDKLLYFMIDATEPAVSDNALVFNNQGAFIGVVTSSQPGVSAGQVIVQGAPLQCGLDKTASYAPTNCGKRALDIWIPGTSVPVVAAGPSNQEYIDVTAAIGKVAQSTQKLIQSCQDLGLAEKSEVRQLIVATSWWDQCSASSVELVSIRNNSSANINRVASSSTLSAGDIALQNTYYDQMNNLFDKVSKIFTELEASVDYFITASALKIGFGTDYEDSMAMFMADKNQIESLPSVLKASIVKLKSYKYLTLKRDSATTSLDDFKMLVTQLSTANLSTEIEQTLNGMQEIADNQDSKLFISNVKTLHSVVPTSYCRNGKKFAFPQKNSQCQKGWNKIKI
jgi:hypothetical protein